MSNVSVIVKHNHTNTIWNEWNIEIFCVNFMPINKSAYLTTYQKHNDFKWFSVNVTFSRLTFCQLHFQADIRQVNIVTWFQWTNCEKEQYKSTLFIPLARFFNQIHISNDFRFFFLIFHFAVGHFVNSCNTHWRHISAPTMNILFIQLLIHILCLFRHFGVAIKFIQWSSDPLKQRQNKTHKSFNKLTIDDTAIWYCFANILQMFFNGKRLLKTRQLTAYSLKCYR